MAEMDRLSTGALTQSLQPGQRDSLKARPDGTMLDGHHRVYILRKRGVDINTLPRDIVIKKDF